MTCDIQVYCMPYTLRRARTHTYTHTHIHTYTHLHALSHTPIEPFTITMLLCLPQVPGSGAAGRTMGLHGEHYHVERNDR